MSDFITLTCVLIGLGYLYLHVNTIPEKPDHRDTLKFLYLFFGLISLTIAPLMNDTTSIALAEINGAYIFSIIMVYVYRIVAG
jgi:hypothetical protein